MVNESGQKSLASCGGCFLFAICCCIPTLCTSWLCFNCYAKCQSDKFTRDLEDAKKEALLGVSSLYCCDTMTASDDRLCDIRVFLRCCC